MHTWARRRLRGEVRRRANAAVAGADDRVAVKVTRKDGWEQIYWKKPEDAAKLVKEGVGRVVSRQEAARTSSPPPLPGSVREVPQGRNWIDKRPDLPEHTWHKHFNQDPYMDERGYEIIVNPERKVLHDQIRGEFFDAVPSVESGAQPIAILTMGGPASGKSSAVGNVDKAKFVVCNPDEVRERLPEYQDAIDVNGTYGASAKNAATMTQGEASFITRQIRRDAIDQRKNVLIDGSGKDAGEYETLIRDLKAKGYYVKLVATDLDADEAAERAKWRAEETGRWVPREYSDKVYDVVPKNFMQISRLADDSGLYSTYSFPPTRVWHWQSASGASRAEEPSLWVQYQQKAGKK
jgi:predicted ABC-type ATPase